METSTPEAMILTAPEVMQIFVHPPKLSLPVQGNKEFQPSGSELESKQIQKALDGRRSLLEEKTVEKLTSLTQAEWVTDRNLALVTRRAGKHFEVMGHDEGVKLWLNPEEILYLLEMKCAELYWSGVSMSLQQGRSVLLSPATGCSEDEYTVYKHLFQLGYRVLRHFVADNLTQYERDIGLDQYTGRKNRSLLGAMEDTTRRRGSCDVKERDVIRVDEMPTMLMEEDPPDDEADPPRDLSMECEEMVLSVASKAATVDTDKIGPDMDVDLSSVTESAMDVDLVTVSKTVSDVNLSTVVKTTSDVDSSPVSKTATDVDLSTAVLSTTDDAPVTKAATDVDMSSVVKPVMDVDSSTVTKTALVVDLSDAAVNSVVVTEPIVDKEIDSASAVKLDLITVSVGDIAVDNTDVLSTATSEMEETSALIAVKELSLPDVTHGSPIEELSAGMSVDIKKDVSVSEKSLQGEEASETHVAKPLTEASPWTADVADQLFCEDIVAEDEKWDALSDVKENDVVDVKPPTPVTKPTVDDESEMIGITLDRQNVADVPSDDEDAAPVVMMLDGDDDGDDVDKEMLSAMIMAPPLKIAPVVEAMKIVDGTRLASHLRFRHTCSPDVVDVDDVDTDEDETTRGAKRRSDGLDVLEVVDLDSTTVDKDMENVAKLEREVIDLDSEASTSRPSVISSCRSMSGKRGPEIVDLEPLGLSRRKESRYGEKITDVVDLDEESVPLQEDIISKRKDAEIVDLSLDVPSSAETQSSVFMPFSPALLHVSSPEDLAVNEASRTPTLQEESSVEPEKPLSAVDFTPIEIVDACQDALILDVEPTVGESSYAEVDKLPVKEGVVDSGKISIPPNEESVLELSPVCAEVDKLAAMESAVDAENIAVPACEELVSKSSPAIESISASVAPINVPSDLEASLNVAEDSSVAEKSVPIVSKETDKIHEDSAPSVTAKIQRQSGINVADTKLISKLENSTQEPDFQVVIGKNNCPILIDMSSVPKDLSHASLSDDLDSGIETSYDAVPAKSQVTGDKRTSEAIESIPASKKPRMDVLSIEESDDSDIIETVEAMNHEELEKSAASLTKPGGIDSGDFLEGLVLNATEKPTSTIDLCSVEVGNSVIKKVPRYSRFAEDDYVNNFSSGDESSDFVDLQIDEDELEESDESDSDIEIVDLESDSDIEEVPVETNKRKRTTDGNDVLPAAKRTAAVVQFVNLSDDETSESGDEDDDDDYDDDDDVVETAPRAPRVKYWSPELYTDKKRMDILTSIPNVYNKMEITLNTPMEVIPPNCSPKPNKVAKLWNIEAVGIGGKPTRDWVPAHEKCQKMEQQQRANFLALEQNYAGPSFDNRSLPHDNAFGENNYPFSTQSPFPFGAPPPGHNFPFGAPPGLSPFGSPQFQHGLHNFESPQFQQHMTAFGIAGNGLLPFPNDMMNPRPPPPWQSPFGQPNMGFMRPGNGFSPFNPILTPRMPNKSLHGVQQVPKPMHDVHAYQPRGWFQQNNWYKGPNKRQVECVPRRNNKVDSKAGIHLVKTEGGPTFGARPPRWDVQCKVESTGIKTESGFPRLPVVGAAQVPVENKPDVNSLNLFQDIANRGSTATMVNSEPPPAISKKLAGILRRKQNKKARRLIAQLEREGATVKLEEDVPQELGGAVDGVLSGDVVGAGEEVIDRPTTGQVDPTLADLRMSVEAEMTEETLHAELTEMPAPPPCVPGAESRVDCQSSVGTNVIELIKSPSLTIKELREKADQRHTVIRENQIKLRKVRQRYFSPSKILRKLQAEDDETRNELDRIAGNVIDVEDGDDSDCQVIESSDEETAVKRESSESDDEAEESVGGDVEAGGDSEESSVEGEKNEEPSEDEGEGVVPLLCAADCKDFGTILSRLDIIKPASLPAAPKTPTSDLPKVSFDVYNPPVDKKTATFRKTDPGLPDYRVVVLGPNDPIPDGEQLSRIQRHLRDDVPVIFAVVHYRSVSFIRLDRISLPPDLTEYGLIGNS